MAKFEDGFGNFTYEDVNMPSRCNDLCEVLPSIDESDRARQSVLVLENKWLTKHC